MSADNKHINYSAGDIQRYLQGKMTPQEMHALEKAALDDELLADAIEGYALVDGEDHKQVLDGLKETLAAKITPAGKVVEMKKGGWRQWYRIAAALFILLGSAAIIYKAVFNQNAGNETAVAKKEVPASVEKPAAQPITDDSLKNVVAINENARKTDSEITSNFKSNESKAEAPVTVKRFSLTDTATTKATVAVSEKTTKDVAVADDKVKEEVTLAKTEIVKPAAPVTANQANAKKYTYDAYKFSKQQNAGITAPAGFGNNNLNTYTQNFFKGRVVDRNNEPLPFARVAIKNDSLRLSTYADAKGYFNFVATDTLLDVDVSSVGYINNSYRMRNGLGGTNKIVMSESTAPLNEVVVAKTNAVRNKSMIDISKDSTKYPVPEDGWDNYDTYLTNNLVIPQQQKHKDIHGRIELSFGIDKNGSPTNITIDKSLHTELDSEAVKAIKDGPRWKNKKRKSKAKVVIEF